MSAATAFAADPVGSYSVAGSNSGGGSKCSGTVTVEKTGQTYRVVWIVGGTRYVGTGIGDKDFLAISYEAGSDTGLALYGSDGGNLAGRADHFQRHRRAGAARAGLVFSLRDVTYCDL